MMPQPQFDSIVSTTRRRESVIHPSDKGIALLTTMLIMLLLSAMVVGISWLMLDDQKLGGNNRDRQRAFYGAEAGMESLTASLENLFDANYAPNKTAINNLLTSPGPTALPNLATNGSGPATPIDLTLAWDTSATAGAGAPPYNAATTPRLHGSLTLGRGRSPSPSRVRLGPAIPRATVTGSSSIIRLLRVASKLTIKVKLHPARGWM
jgi:hypothetical protein